MILNWLQTFKAGDPVRKVCSVRNMNRIANILNNIEGIGCRIVKNTTAEGRDWKIVVDGGTDVTPDQVPSGWPYRPGGASVFTGRAYAPDGKETTGLTSDTNKPYVKFNFATSEFTEENGPPPYPWGQNEVWRRKAGVAGDIYIR